MTTDQRRAAIAVVQAIADCIRELGEVPSGHLYARLMGHMSLEQYNGVISTLKMAGLVKETNHLLTWIGTR